MEGIDGYFRGAVGSPPPGDGPSLGLYLDNSHVRFARPKIFKTLIMFSELKNTQFRVKSPHTR